MPIEAVVGITTWVVFWAAVVGVILGTHRRLEARRRVPTEPDARAFSEVRPAKYLVVAFCVGALVLPVYFYSVHRTARGFLIGLAWLLGIVIGVFAVRRAVLAVAAPGPFVEIWRMEDLEMRAPDPILGSFSAGSFLGAHVTDFQDGVVPENSIVWSEEGKGEFGRGRSVGGSFGPGKHTIRVTVTDSDGNRAEETGTFNVTVR